jgi:hypothetical protein
LASETFRWSLAISAAVIFGARDATGQGDATNRRFELAASLSEHRRSL